MSSHILECKQCGGEVPCEEGKQVVICPFCHSKNTVSKAIGTQGGLVNRANYLRRNNEFDKAIEIYEDLLKTDNSDYEAHWGMVLCKYGIEYVEDPASGKRLPTCHRTHNESILLDISYKAALEYAPLDVREVYEAEAAQIDRIQKNILALAQKQEHYDVFICYKEEDGAGNRTEDSVIAQELEFELSKRGYKVFFARKTLERVLGSEYEPIIFAALQSAKVMVVLGTKPEHFNAVWVKNEWSRYRELIRKGAQKALIPAYRGMSPYDLPQEFSNLQALDMSKLGFVQDLCDGIDRFTRSPQRQAAPVNAPILPATEPLLKRAYLFIEENNFTKAGEYFERILDMNPEEPRAYAGKLMVQFGVNREELLSQATQPLDGSPCYAKIMSFGDDAMRARFTAYNQSAAERANRIALAEKAEADRRRWVADMEANSVRGCLKRMPSGALAITFGALFLFGALIYMISGFVEAAYGDSDSMSGLVFRCMLATVPGGLLLGIGNNSNARKKRFKMYSSKLQSGVKISELAGAAGIQEKYLIRELNIIINRQYLQDAYLSGGSLYFKYENISNSWHKAQ